MTLTQISTQGMFSKKKKKHSKKTIINTDKHDNTMLNKLKLKEVSALTSK